MKLVLVLPALALSLAACSAEPEIRTIEVPGKTVTKTVTTPGPTKTVTVKEVPQGCLDAIAAAEGFAAATNEVVAIAAQYPEMISDAAIAGYEQDPTAIGAITSRLEELTSELSDINPRVEALVTSFNTGKSECAQ